jgi:hypothetical protein
MVYCSKCNSINIRVHDLGFAKKIQDGQLAPKFENSKQQFICDSCNHSWFSDPEAEKLYFEYVGLKERTTLVAKTMKPGGTYTAQYINPQELMRRGELAKILFLKYKSYLDISPEEWYNIEFESD